MYKEAITSWGVNSLTTIGNYYRFYLAYRVNVGVTAHCQLRDIPYKNDFSIETHDMRFSRLSFYLEKYTDIPFFFSEWRLDLER